jgi:NAD(P)-dependent dehydrogenase (short-subunit alcohol dehydrogenase family)
MSGKEFSLGGKVIVVTGAAGLIGTEVCDAFAAYGGAVVLTDYGPAAALEDRAQELQERYPAARTLAVRADVTSDESVGRLFERVDREFGRIDVLVNLAAIDAKFDAREGEVEPTRFENYPLSAWETSLAVNGTGLLRVTQEAARRMLSQKRGNIINVPSTYALVAPNQALYREPGRDRQTYKPVDYVATKSMVPNLTRYLATLYARDGIRCNCVVPHGVFNDHPRAFQDRFAELSPIGRMCDVGELRGPFVFLASDASSYMTGAVLVVDGGWTAW